jgi:lipopolysaccharide transport protein LptA
MRVFALVALFAFGMAKASLLAQSSVAAAQTHASVTPSPNKSDAGQAPAAKGLLNPEQPVTTEIYADEAFFDSAKNIGKFTGHVKVVDPRFNMQSDKLTAYISKENQGLEKAVASSNVGVVRDRPDPKGGPPLRSIGLADNAIYTTNDGNVELSGNPRVQQGLNMHVATSADTVMVLNQDGQLTTRGPSRTEIRQEPSPTPSPSPTPAKQ